MIHHDWFFLGDFHTYDYAPKVDLEHTWIGNAGSLPSKLNWKHTLPDRFQFPPYDVTRAKLWTNVTSVNNIVEVSSLIEWDAPNNR